MTNANSIFWGAMRQRDILGGLAIFIALNSALFAIIILASDISSSGQVALAIFAVLSNFLVWLWNDSGIKDVHAGSKDITGDDAETAIAQEFKKAPWAFYPRNRDRDRAGNSRLGALRAVRLIDCRPTLDRASVGNTVNLTPCACCR